MASQSDNKLKAKGYIINSIANSLFFVIDPYINDMPAVTMAECKVPLNWNTIINKYGFCNEAKATIKAIQESGGFDNSADSTKAIYNAYECENCSPCCDNAAQISIANSATVNVGAYNVFVQNVRYTLDAISRLHSDASSPAASNQAAAIISALSVSKINITLDSLKKLQSDMGVGTIGETVFVGILADEVINEVVLAAIDNYIAALSASAIAAVVKNKDAISAPAVADADSKLKSVNSGRLAQVLKDKANADKRKNQSPPAEKDKHSGAGKLSIAWIVFIVSIVVSLLLAAISSVNWWRKRQAEIRAGI